MNKNTDRPFLRCLGVTIAFWALVLLGPGLVIIWNNISAWFSGGGFYEGSFGYKLLVFFSQTIACGLAYSAAEAISDGKHQVCVLINEIVCICLLILLALSCFLLIDEILNGLNYTVSTITTIICAVYTAKTLSQPLQKDL